MAPKKLPPLVYWDSTCFIAWLKKEKDRIDKCREVLDAAQRGKVRIATSAITLAEVVKLDKGPVQLTADQETKIRKFFQRSYIVLIQVNRQIAEEARQLIWKEGLHTRDAVHVATARLSKISEVHAFDGHFLDLDGKIDSIKVCVPGVAQPPLPLLAGVEREDEIDGQVH